MSKDNAVAQTSVEMIAAWEDLAIPAPGVLFAEKQVERLACAGDPADLASWIMVTACSGVLGNTAQALTTKVRAVLSVWRQRFGQAKIDELRKLLFTMMRKHRNDPKITDQELTERINVLFDGIER